MVDTLQLTTALSRNFSSLYSILVLKFDSRDNLSWPVSLVSGVVELSKLVISTRGRGYTFLRPPLALALELRKGVLLNWVPLDIWKGHLALAN